ncbi:MAG: MBL fold metallo-hydrolase [Kordiimonadales bacterium]|nr:MAG: MBL fold metallo-hydrolase [Kordiimonadales bacterium]
MIATKPIIGIALFLAVLFTCPVTADMQLVLLGTGTPNPVPERAGAATAIIVDGQVWIIDAGPGVVRRISAAHRNGVKALSQPSLSKLLITHLHSDHTLGLPDLIYAPWTLERTAPIEIRGPKGTANMVSHIEQAYAKDVTFRIEGAEPANTTGWKTKVTEINGGVIYKSDTLTIEAIPVCHGGWDHAFGFKFTHKGKSIVISGDTTYCPALEAAAANADILVHEVYDAAALAKRDANWQAYHRAAHTSGPELGKLAANAKPKHLILHHQLAWSGSKEAILAQIAQSFSGKVTWGEDLMVFNVGVGAD